MVFADAAARTAAISSPAAGMMTFLVDVAAVNVYDGAAWVEVSGGAVLQVVSTTKTDTFSVSQVAGSSDAITGLTASITPSSTSSKILVTVAVSAAKASPYNPAIDITADGSVIASPDSPGSRVPAMFVGALSSDVSQAQTISGTSLHSPATTSSITYGVNLVNVRSATVVSYVNRSSDDVDGQARGRYVSTITLMEVAG